MTEMMEPEEATPEELLEAVRSAPTAGLREQAIGVFLEKMEPGHVRIARHVATKYNRHRSATFDDVAQQVRSAAEALCREYAAGKIETIDSWFALVRNRVNQLMPRFIDRFDSQFGGQTALQRKLRRAEGVRGMLRSTLGREPTDAEVVDEVNRQQAMRRSNPAKEGRLTVADLAATSKTVSLDEAPDAYSVGTEMASSQHQAGLHTTELPEFIAEVIRTCHEQAATTGRVAEAWLAAEVEGLDSSGDAIGKIVGVQPSTARQHIVKVRATCKTVLRARYQVNSPYG